MKIDKITFNGNDIEYIDDDAIYVSSRSLARIFSRSVAAFTKNIDNTKTIHREKFIHSDDAVNKVSNLVKTSKEDKKAVISVIESIKHIDDIPEITGITSLDRLLGERECLMKKNHDIVSRIADIDEEVASYLNMINDDVNNVINKTPEVN